MPKEHITHRAGTRTFIWDFYTLFNIAFYGLVIFQDFSHNFEFKYLYFQGVVLLAKVSTEVKEMKEWVHIQFAAFVTFVLAAICGSGVNTSALQSDDKSNSTKIQLFSTELHHEQITSDVSGEYRLSTTNLEDNESLQRGFRKRRRKIRLRPRPQRRRKIPRQRRPQRPQRQRQRWPKRRKKYRKEETSSVGLFQTMSLASGAFGVAFSTIHGTLETLVGAVGLFLYVIYSVISIPFQGFMGTQERALISGF